MNIRLKPEVKHFMRCVWARFASGQRAFTAATMDESLGETGSELLAMMSGYIVSIERRQMRGLEGSRTWLGAFGDNRVRYAIEWVQNLARENNRRAMARLAERSVRTGGRLA